MKHRTITRSTILRWTRFAAFGAVLALPLGSVAWGQDRDDYSYNHDEARDQASRNGYRDGARAGENDRERGRRFNFKNDDWEDSRGYEHWMGSKGQYKHAYREAFERGYRRAYSGDRRDWDRDDYRSHDRDWR